MQLLRSTAEDEQIGIKHVEKPWQNIHAGIKYAAPLRYRYFDDPAISPDDQMRFTPAAYNAGPGTVNRIRGLAEKNGCDKNKWFDNREVAALRLVGQETVRYVRNINKYYVALKLGYGIEFHGLSPAPPGPLVLADPARTSKRPWRSSRRRRPKSTGNPQIHREGGKA